MNEQPSTEWKDESEELSADDLAALQAFEERDTWATGPLPQLPTSSTTLYEETPQGNPDDDLDDMLMIFASEIDEDITRLRHALSLLEQDDTLDLSRFTPIRRIGHKIRGTAGSVDYTVIEAIGSIMEEIVDQTLQHRLFPLIAISVLVQAVHALERTLESLLNSGHERPDALADLENDLVQLNITYADSSTTSTVATTLPSDVPHNAPESLSLSPVSIPHRPVPLPAPTLASLHVDERRFEQLIQRSEYLVEQRIPLENARIQLQDALQELHHAQASLQLQAFALDKLTSNAGHALTAETQTDRSVSSLIARVLDHVAQQKPRSSSSNVSDYAHVRPALHRTKSRLVKVDGAWDTLEVTRYTDLDETLRTISEAISNVSLASSHVRASYDHLNTTLQKYISHATSVRKNALLLRLTPVSVLTTHLRQVIESSKGEQSPYNIVFEVTGENTELDSTILEELTQPLLTFLQTCVADIFIDTENTEKGVDDARRIWLHVQCVGNEVVIELGFSMTVQGGALEMLQDAVQRVGGTLALQRNTHHGVSFLLQVPRTQGTVRGLLLQVGSQQVIVPFSQVQRIDDEKHAALDITYYLHRLLDIPNDLNEVQTKQQSMPLLVLPKGTSRLVAGVLVHEVLTDVEVVVKPLPTYLQRPGVTGAGIDGKGNVQLVLNLQELIRHYNTSLRHTLPEQDMVSTKTATPRVLIADDSLVMRQSLLQTLQRAHYETAEAIDGLQALEQLTRNPPDVFLLDMEMPNLSGYDVLSIMHLYHELNDVKVIMLTSRSSEKHKRHAMELGAHAYLTKPCPDDVLLETITKIIGISE